MKRLRKWGLTLIATLSITTTVLLLTGAGTAVAAQINNVFVTNTAENPVPVSLPNTTVSVHEQGTVGVNVNGVVTVAPAIPASAFSASFSGFAAITCADEGTRWFISSFAAANESATAPVTVSIALSGNRELTIVVPPNGTDQLTFPQPFVVTQQEPGSACLHVIVESDAPASVATWAVVGYHD